MNSPDCCWEVIERGMAEGTAYMITRCNYCHYETAFRNALFTAEVNGRCVLGAEHRWQSQSVNDLEHDDDEISDVDCTTDSVPG